MESDATAFFPTPVCISMRPATAQQMAAAEGTGIRDDPQQATAAVWVSCCEGAFGHGLPNWLAGVRVIRKLSGQELLQLDRGQLKVETRAIK